VVVSFILFFAISNRKNKIPVQSFSYQKLERKIKCINTMSEVELYTIQSKFNQARTEYMALIESIQTDCLGNQMSTECQKAASLNADMQTYLLQMSNMIKNKPNTYTNQKELLAISNQLGGDMENLTTLEQEEADGQVLANMSYVHALTWTLATITIVWFLIRK
jgi:hypothetical protein